MIQRMSVSALLIALLVSLGGVAQDSKTPTLPTESKPEAAAVSPIEIAVAAELADRSQAQQAITWLSKPTDVSFTDIPLGDAAKFLADYHQARIRVDAATFVDTPLIVEAHVTLIVEKQPLSHVLNRLAQSAGAVWTIHRGDIFITSPTREQELMEARVYPVGRLLRLSASRAVLPAPPPRPLVAGFSGMAPLVHEQTNDDVLTRFVTESTGVSWQFTSGEGGTLSLLGDQLVVRQTYRGHEEVARLLRFAEVALNRAPGSPPLLVLSAEESAELARLQKVLRREVELHFVQTQLSEVVNLLRERLEENVYVEESEVTKPLNLGNQEFSLPEGRYVAREALRQVLAPTNLAAVIDDGTIRITTTEQARQQLLIVIYDVADLLRTNDDLQALQNSIQQSTSGPWQQIQGEGGTISDLLGGLLVIRQNEHVHTEISLLLQELRQARKEIAKDSATPKPNEPETRFHKAKSKEEAEALERLILTFVAPTTWDVSGGRGVLRTAEDRLIIQHTKAVHDQIDQFLREYQQAKPIGATTK